MKGLTDEEFNFLLRATKEGWFVSSDEEQMLFRLDQRGVFNNSTPFILNDREYFIRTVNAQGKLAMRIYLATKTLL